MDSDPWPEADDAPTPTPQQADDPPTSGSCFVSFLRWTFILIGGLVGGIIGLVYLFTGLDSIVANRDSGGSMLALLLVIAPFVVLILYGSIFAPSGTASPLSGLFSEGLGVRILGEVRREYADLLRRADAIFIEELRQTRDENGVSWYDRTSQAFAVFLPVKSVGVMGDGRTYDYVVALRAVITSDFMTAHWAELPYGLLGRVSNRIINEVRGINRVVYDVSGKPPATIEWE